MGRHLENFVCIFLFISIRDLAPHNYKQLIVRNARLGTAKRLVCFVRMSRTLNQPEFPETEFLKCSCSQIFASLDGFRVVQTAELQSLGC